MQNFIEKDLPCFFIAGINHVKTNTTTRSLFSFDKTQYQNLTPVIKESTIHECFILSTCNRTEIYGFSENATPLIQLLCRETNGNRETFQNQAYIFRGEEAVKHLFEVACGLDSQILGDFEITAQVKQALKLSKKAGLLGTFTEKLVNAALQASKQVKNKTKLSSGVVSTSFSVIQCLKQIPNVRDKHILLYGIGKIGRSTCKNIVNYLGCEHVTLVNRTEEKAKDFAHELGLKSIPETALKKQLIETDIVLVATNAPHPTLLKKDLSERNKIVIDLSIPFNVDAAIRERTDIKTIDIDQLSQIQDKTLEDRKKETPKAHAIINQHLQDFLQWNRNRKNGIVLKAMKEKMEAIHQREMSYFQKETQSEVREEDLELLSSRMIQKTINVFAVKLKNANGNGENYRQVLGDFFETPLNINKDEANH